jgi:transcriptional regulator with GAF, ATPase, and Fis domain
MKPPTPPPPQGPTLKRPRPQRMDEARPGYLLTVVEGPDVGLAVTLDGASPTRVLLGTSPVCPVRLTDAEVSRRHATFSVAADHVELMDLGSTNGTRVNGVVVKEVSLYGGEVIRAGRSVITIQLGEAFVADLGTMMSFGRVLGESMAMRRIYPILERLAATDQPVLIEGETGTGKELVAEEIHRASPRRDSPFVVLEASALPQAEVTSELFGTPVEPGLLQKARGGTLFIDEIGDLTRRTQKALQTELTQGHVRVIGATRRDLDRDVTSQRFDESLFFNLAAGRVELPPLRDRQGDVFLLARHFWNELTQATGELPADLLPRFEEHRWPGNVRELRSLVLRRATIGALPATHLSDRAREEGTDFIDAVIQDDLAFPAARDRVVSEFERRYVERVLGRHGGNVSQAARASGVAYRYFQLVRARLK